MTRSRLLKHSLEMRRMNKSVLLTLLAYFCSSLVIEFTGSWLATSSIWFSSLLGPFRLYFPLYTVYFYMLGLVVAFREIRVVRRVGMVLYAYGSCWIAFYMVKYLVEDQTTLQAVFRAGWDLLPCTLLLCTAFVGLNWHAFESLYGRSVVSRRIQS